MNKYRHMVMLISKRKRKNKEEKKEEDKEELEKNVIKERKRNKTR